MSFIPKFHIKKYDGLDNVYSREAKSQIGGNGDHFLPALALCDLCKHVLDSTGRGAEGRERLEGAVLQLACSVEDLDRVVNP